MTNATHADRLTAEADEAMRRRRALLTASCALGTTKTIPAARRALAEWDGPGTIRDQALAIINALAAETA